MKYSSYRILIVEMVGAVLKAYMIIIVKRISSRSEWSIKMRQY
jgi:hypothetical protein